jgi:preprotein translocase SecE subunit
MSIASAVVNYLRSSKAELMKVSWPSRRDTIRYSTLVFTVSIVVAVFFAALDYGLGKVVTVALTQRQNALQTQAQTQAQTQTATTTSAPAPTPTPTFDLTNESPTLDTTGSDTKTNPKP